MLAEQKISVVDRCMIDADYFKVDLIPKVDDGMYLPLVQRYGGLQTFGSIGDGDLRVFNWPADIEKQWLNNRYGGSPKGPNLFHSDKDARPEDIVHYLQR